MIKYLPHRQYLLNKQVTCTTIIHQTIFNVNRSILFRFVLLLSFAALIWSCKKEPDLLGLDLIPESDLLNHEYIDTITIEAVTELEDTIRTDELTSLLLGSFADPVFGTTTASIYTQIRLPYPKVNFGTDVVVDSIVLTIPYKGVYGDSTSIMNLSVYELSEVIRTDTAVVVDDDTANINYPYFNFSTLSHESNPIAQFSFEPNTIDSSLRIYDGDTTEMPPHLRIPLSLSFANKIINGDTTALANNTGFVQYIKGLYLATDPVFTTGQGCIMYLNPLHSQSRVTMYYRTTRNDIRDTTSIAFLLSDAGRFNNYNHHGYENASPDFLEQIQNNVSTGDKLYLHPLAGTMIKITFPYLSQLAKKKMAINEARLVFDNATDDVDLYPMPNAIGIREKTKTFQLYLNDSITTYKEIIDQAEGANYINGNRDGEQYFLRLSRYVQQRIQNPDINFKPLYILPIDRAINARRAILNSPNAATGRLRLLIYYTPLN